MASMETSTEGAKLVPPFDIEHEITCQPISTHERPLPGSPSLSISGTPKQPPVTEYIAEIPGNPILINESVPEYLGGQLSVKFLNHIDQYLWWAGQSGRDHTRPHYRQRLKFWESRQRAPNDKIRPLHRLVSMRREIIITEDPCLHLTKFQGSIYIKPLPLYLLHWNFFDQYICPDEVLYGYAVGFLFTYVYLVRSQHDFRIAVENGLMPEHVTWAGWSSLATKLAQINPNTMNKRYHYGELKLRRLNLIFLFWGGTMPFEFFAKDDRYITRYFGWWVWVFGFLSILLSAMQVGLAVGDVTATFQKTSYIFAVAALVAVAASVGIVVIVEVVIRLCFCWSVLHHMFFFVRRQWDRIPL